MNKIETLIFDLTQTILKDLKSDLYIDSVESIKEEFNIIRVLVDADHNIDLAEIIPITEQLQTKIQDLDEFPDGYYVEIASVGVEKPLKTLDAIKNQIGNYIYVKLKEVINKDNEWYGTVKEVKEDKIILTINDKGRIKNIEIPYEKIISARCAVKF